MGRSGYEDVVYLGAIIGGALGMLIGVLWGIQFSGRKEVL